jgi:LPXTG-site transpeptidase (sortase) family protein
MRYRKISTSTLNYLFGVLIGLGLILLGSLALKQNSSIKAAPAQTFPVTAHHIQNDASVISGRPIQIAIPNVGIDLKVIPGYYYRSSNSWSLSLNNAQWGVMTAPANNKDGQTFIYAHQRKGVFQNLAKVQPGDTAIVKTDNGHSFTYVFRRNDVTSPTNTSVLAYQGKPRLLLQTCSGLWFQNRQLFYFDLERTD